MKSNLNNDCNHGNSRINKQKPGLDTENIDPG